MQTDHWQEYTIKFGAGCTQCKSKMFEGVKAWKHIHKKFIACSKECMNKLDQKAA